MSRWIPCKRREFIRKLRALCVEGPYGGTRHQFMIHKSHRLAIPTNSELSVPQLRFVLREVETILGQKLTLENWTDL